MHYTPTSLIFRKDIKMVSNISLLRKKILKINALIFLFVASMFLPLVIFNVIISFALGGFYFFWDMDTESRLITFLLSIIMTFLTWLMALEHLNIRSLKELLDN